MFGSFLPGLWLVGTTKVYSGIGADIVMESITLIDPDRAFPDEFTHESTLVSLQLGTVLGIWRSDGVPAGSQLT
jgi:hypothetical protein